MSHDDWETPAASLLALQPYLPSTQTPIWMPFYLNGSCANTVRSMGYTVYHKDEDFFTTAPPSTNCFILDNVPFSKKKQVLQHLLSLQIPFMILLPLTVLGTQFFRDTLQNSNKLHVLIPYNRIRFNGTSRDPPFHTVWIAYDCEWLHNQNQLVFM